MSNSATATETVNDQTLEVPKDDGFRVYIGNLSFKATEEQVREFASKSGGEITSVVLPKRFKRPAGFAFVHYKTEEAAKEAVEKLQDAELDGRKVTLQVARSKEEQAQRREAILEKRNAARAAREAKQKEKADAKANGGDAEAAEKPKKQHVPKKASRRRVPGQDDEEAEATAEASEGAAANGGQKPKRKPKARKPREARIDSGEESGAAEKKETPKERKPREKRELTGELSPNTIFVANLPFNVDDDALAAIFTNLSIRVKTAKVVKGLRRSRNGRPFRASRGFGFVEVEDPAQQKEAVEKVEGSLIGERKISAKIANELKPLELEQAANDAEGAEAPASTA